MATTLKAVLDTMAAAIEAVGSGSGDVRLYGWTRLADSTETKWQAGGYRLLVADFDRDREFGIDATETLAGPITAEFYREAQAEDDGSFFVELSALAKAVESAAYPAGTIAVIVRSRKVERNFASPAEVTGALSVNLKWEQSY
jgi:hypothetical protein